MLDTRPLAYRPSTFAKLTGLSLSFVKLEIYRGNLKAVKKGIRAWVIPAAAVDEYLSQSQEKETKSQANLPGATCDLAANR